MPWIQTIRRYCLHRLAHCHRHIAEKDKNSTARKQTGESIDNSSDYAVKEAVVVEFIVRGHCKVNPKTSTDWVEHLGSCINPHLQGRCALTGHMVQLIIYLNWSKVFNIEILDLWSAHTLDIHEWWIFVPEEYLGLCLFYEQSTLIIN